MSNQLALRDAYGRALSRLGISYSNLVVLDAGQSEITRTVYFAREFPERFFQIGVSEQDLVNAATGMALCGKSVFASTCAVLGTRAWEQMRNGPARERLPVRLCCTHAGLSASEEGAPWQVLEDVALFRSIPNLSVFVPCDAAQTEEVVEYLVEHPEDGPAYIRLGRAEVPVLPRPEASFRPGHAQRVREGKDATVAAAGPMLGRALEAAEALAADGIDVRVLDMCSVKPIDAAALLAAAEETVGIVTVEEGSVLGGLGSAVAEVVAEGCPARVLRVGVADRFGESGRVAELHARFGLTTEAICERVRSLVTGPR